MGDVAGDVAVGLWCSVRVGDIAGDVTAGRRGSEIEGDVAADDDDIVDVVVRSGRDIEGDVPMVLLMPLLLAVLDGTATLIVVVTGDLGRSVSVGDVASSLCLIASARVGDVEYVAFGDIEYVVAADVVGTTEILAEEEDADSEYDVVPLGDIEYIVVVAVVVVGDVEYDEDAEDDGEGTLTEPWSLSSFSWRDFLGS